MHGKFRAMVSGCCGGNHILSLSLLLTAPRLKPAGVDAERGGLGLGRVPQKPRRLLEMCSKFLVTFGNNCELITVLIDLRLVTRIRNVNRKYDYRIMVLVSVFYFILDLSIL